MDHLEWSVLSVGGESLGLYMRSDRVITSSYRINKRLTVYHLLLAPPHTTLDIYTKLHSVSVEFEIVIKDFKGLYKSL